MAGIAEKLYPPKISGTLPAFYGETDNGVTSARVVIPFSMNRAVSSSDIGGFSLKIKTVQSNTLIATLSTSYEEVLESSDDRQVIFFWEEIPSKVKIGQFLKVQLAYIDKDSGQPGYYSTVGIIKYTSKPNVYIDKLQSDNSRIEAFRSTYTGIYEVSEDKTERPYSYCFYLYDSEENLIETSGWLLHNTTINNVASESLSLTRTTDSYTFETQAVPDKEYYIQYTVRTINNLEISSPVYLCLEPYIGMPTLLTKLNAENIFDEGYIKISLSLADGITTMPELEKPVSIEICRSEKTDNFSSWRTMQCVYFSDYNYAINEWDFKDFTIEQGVTYKYCFRQYNENGIQSERFFSNEVFADFEDMFLWDGKKQLKIRFNPQVSSFKITHLEQKSDTIGSRYPFIFRNGKVGYKEFPISGLISYLADFNEMFINHQEDLNIILRQYSERETTPANKNDSETRKAWENSETLNTVGYNMRAERRFKLQILDWLGNGEIKMFKSPAEGNYFVRLLNISLSPENKLSRMLHSFSCTAYEVEEFNYKNLLNLGFLNPQNADSAYLAVKSVRLIDLISDDINLNTPIKINTSPIIESLKIYKSTDDNKDLYLRIGMGSNSKVAIPYGTFSIEQENKKIPDLYFYPNDHNPSIYTDEDSKANKISKLHNLIGDTIITYKYYETKVLAGDLNNIKDVYLQNITETLIGNTTKNFELQQINNKKTSETTKFFSIEVHKKNHYTLLYEASSGKYYEAFSPYKTVSTSTLDKLTVYDIYNYDSTKTNRKGSFNTYCIFNESRGFHGPISNLSSQVKLTYKELDDNNTINSYITAEEFPIHIDLSNKNYTKFEVGNEVYINYSCQNKIIEYN